MFRMSAWLPRRCIAEAWRRVARDLPWHLKDGGEPALVARTRHWNETVIRGTGVSALLLPQWGSRMPGCTDCCRSTGLKEGFARIA
jgi:hypothetical protein